MTTEKMITVDDWLRRYQQRMIDVAGVTPQQAEQFSKAESFLVLREGFEDNPEAAADEEMSYWEP